MISEVSQPVLVDMDGVLYDTYPYALQLYREAGGEKVGVDAMKTYKIGDHLADPELFYALMAQEHFFRDIPLMEGAHDFMQVLMEAGLEPVIVSTCRERFPFSERDKRRALRRDFPWLDERNIIFAERKELIRGYCIVEDRIENVENFPGHGILMAAPYNEAGRGRYPRFERLTDIARYIVFFAKMHCDAVHATRQTLSGQGM